MHDVHALLAFLFQIRVQVRLRRRLALALGRHGQEPVRLEHDQHVVVFVKDGQSGREHRLHRFLSDLDQLIHVHFATGVLLDLPVHAYAAGLQQLPQGGLGGVGIEDGERLEQRLWRADDVPHSSVSR